MSRNSARQMGLELEEQKARYLDEQRFMSAVFDLEEPVADIAVFPLWLIAEQAGGVSTNFISGHGADELLGGYPRYHFLQKTHGARQRVPVNLLSGIAPVLPPNLIVRRGARYLTAGHENLEGYFSLLAVFDHDERAELYTDTMQSAIHEKGGSAEILRPYFTERDLTRNLLALDLGVGLPDLLLAECDRLFAAHGVELEYPYMDDALVDFAVSVPARVKFGVRSKALLRHAMRGAMPALVRLTPRRGFRVPREGPLVRTIENVARNTITRDRVEASGLFKWPVVARVLRAYTHNIYCRRQFWALLMFFSWYRKYIEE